MEEVAAPLDLKQKSTTKAGKGFDASVSDYRLSVRAHVRGLWRGEFDFFSFTDGMTSTIRRGFTRAWFEGAESCGITPSELTSEELTRLDQSIQVEQGFLVRFAQDIMEESREQGGKLTPLLNRANMWVNRYEEVRSLAMQRACGDKKLKWVWNPVKEHCGDCQNLNGRVYRASVWRKYDLRPRMFGLECRGFNCGCTFVPTSAPVTPGRPPNVGS